MPKAAAVIDIGSSEVRLKVGLNRNGKLKILENMVQPLSIGRETFSEGKISFEKSEKACRIIQNYLKAAKDYGVESVRLVATSAVGEASNSAYIVDQIALKTGLNVEIIDNQEEKFYIYKLMHDMLEPKYKESALMVYIGSGNLGLSLIENGKIPYIQNISTGALRLTEMFETLHNYSSNFHVVVEEYLQGFTEFLESNLPKKIKTFVASGSEINLIADLCGEAQEGDLIIIKRAQFDELFENIKFKSETRIVEDYGISTEQAELLLPAMCIYNILLSYTEASTIIHPKAYLIDEVLLETLFVEKYEEINAKFNKNAAVCAERIAERFASDSEHYHAVTRYSLKIFDKLRKVHGMGAKERVLITVAAILHDAGKVINPKNHCTHSFNIIKGLEITALNEHDVTIVANIARYHSGAPPRREDAGYAALSEKERVIVSKLAAILRIADSLDHGHKRKITDIDIKTNDTEFILTVCANENIELEEWSFLDKGRFFQDVFGLKILMKKKKAVTADD